MGEDYLHICDEYSAFLLPKALPPSLLETMARPVQKVYDLLSHQPTMRRTLLEEKCDTASISKGERHYALNELEKHRLIATPNNTSLVARMTVGDMVNYIQTMVEQTGHTGVYKVIRSEKPEDYTTLMFGRDDTHAKLCYVAFRDRVLFGSKTVEKDGKKVRAVNVMKEGSEKFKLCPENKVLSPLLTQGLDAHIKVVGVPSEKLQNGEYPIHLSTLPPLQVSSVQGAVMDAVKLHDEAQR